MEIKRVGVVGAGTMGNGIAHVFARAGYAVVLCDVQQDFLARALDTTLFIKNGPCMAGLGLGGEGYLSYSIATPTGEGVTNPRTFDRVRRCVMVDNLRIY